MNQRTMDYRFSSAKNLALWILQFVTAAGFLLIGRATLAGYPLFVEPFDRMGIGGWPRHLVAGIEIASAFLLLFPRLAALGALLLIGTMTGPVLSHMVLVGGSRVPALVLLGFAGVVLWGRFGPLKRSLLRLSVFNKRRHTAMSMERRSALMNGTVHLPGRSDNAYRPH